MTVQPASSYMPDDPDKVDIAFAAVAFEVSRTPRQWARLHAGALEMLAREQPLLFNGQVVGLVAKARKHRLAWEQLAALTPWLMRQDIAPLPRQLREWILDRLDGATPPPGPAPKLARDLEILKDIVRGQRSNPDLPTTRRVDKNRGGQAIEGQSHCDNVAIKYSLNFKSVVGIWYANQDVVRDATRYLNNPPK